ncbi:MAG: squalene synthase HpnC, partial [Betaproteobacteria bacterium]|nr:squalene synthase HpnC [Betaproteobacteria bacterium]
MQYGMGVDHYENFPVGSLLLPKPLRRPVMAIYRFARAADDIADEGTATASARLAQLDVFAAKVRVLDGDTRPDDPIFTELQAAIQNFDLPLPPFLDLLDAFKQDVVQGRYETHAEVLAYCERSANPIGRLLLNLYGHTSPAQISQSDAICTSLQLINFLQDVVSDYRRGRIYLPQEELRRFGVNEGQIAKHDPSGGWSPLMEFQIRRIRDLMESGRPLGRALPGRIGLELRMIVAGGTRILDKIAAIGGDVF